MVIYLSWVVYLKWTLIRGMVPFRTPLAMLETSLAILFAGFLTNPLVALKGLVQNDMVAWCLVLVLLTLGVRE